jgi:uncharacterized RDD family membrane protein YckC
MSQPDYLISTPENVDLHLELAGLGNRIMACMIDTTLTYALVALAGILCMFLVAGLNYLPLTSNLRATAMYSLIGITVLLCLIIYFGYYIYFEIAWRGQSPGKRMMHIRVIDENGQPITAASAWIRNLIRVADMGLALIGLLVMLVEPREKRIGDLAAGTLVIRERMSGETIAPVVLKYPQAGDVHIDIGRLTPKEYEMLISFLGRREKLVPSQRQLLARRLENYFRDRLGESNDATAPEQFLERVFNAYQVRAELD